MAATLTTQCIYWILWKEKHFENQSWLYHLLPIHILSMVFQEISSFTPILLVIFIWRFYRVVRHLQNYTLVKIALQVPLLVDLLESNSTLLYCLVSCVWCICGSLCLERVNSQQILYRCRFSSYQCLLYEHSQYYLVMHISTLMRGQILVYWFSYLIPCSYFF